MDIITNIMELIAAKGVEQQEFCRAIGITPTLLSEWKAGRKKSYMKYLPQISEYFGVSVDYLLGTKKESANPKVSTDEIIKMIDALSEKQKQEFVAKFIEFMTKQ